jgi:hypothetical protein
MNSSGVKLYDHIEKLEDKEHSNLKCHKPINKNRISGNVVINTKYEPVESSKKSKIKKFSRIYSNYNPALDSNNQQDRHK